MTFGRLVLRNLTFHWRGQLAVMLGVMVGTAVLTGALLVGDSLRGSMQARAEQQLGWIDHLLIGPHFLHQELPSELDADHACPALVFHGSAANVSSGKESTVGRVSVLGIDERFWHNGPAPRGNDFWSEKHAAPGKVVLGKALAEMLDASAGDTITLQIPKVAFIPRESALGHRDADSAMTSLTLTVADVLDDAHFGSRFSLQPGAAAPRNAFLPLSVLQQALEEAAEAEREKIVVRGQINAVFARGSTEALKVSLREHLTLADLGLTLHDPLTRTRGVQALMKQLMRDPTTRLPRAVQEDLGTAFVQAADKNEDGRLSEDEILSYFKRERNYLSLESRQLLLDPAMVESAEKASEAAKLRSASSLVYLVHSMSIEGQPERFYVLTCAVDPTADEPLAPAGTRTLKDDEILLLDWKEPGTEHQLFDGLREGMELKLAYYDPEKEEVLHEGVPLKFAGFVERKGAAADPYLTPDIPGVTNQKRSEWRLPRQLHYDKKKLHRSDDFFWNEHRTTPRAFVTLKTGQRLWGSQRFGNTTTFRMVSEDRSRSLEDVGEAFRKEFRKVYQPEKSGLVFEPVRANRLKSGTQGTDFGSLFLGFSFFLIVAALLLVGLMFRLNLDRRASEIGLLSATGYRTSTVRNVLLLEAMVLSLGGVILGLPAATGYAYGLLHLLRFLWPEKLDESFLQLHIAWQSPVIGASATMLVSVATVFLTMRMLKRVPARRLLAGVTTPETDPQRVERPPRKSVWLAVICAATAVVALGAGFLIHEHEAQAGAFFTGGILLLTAMLAGLWAWMHRRSGAVRGHGSVAVGRLAVRNAARHPLRSLLTAGLLASAAFVVVAVQSFRKEPSKDFLEKQSGSGGYALLAESGLPSYHALETEIGKKEIAGKLRNRLQEQGQPSQAAYDDAVQLLERVHFTSCRLRAGDDASCLNLTAPRRPRVLGLPSAFLGDRRFRFAGSEAKTNEERANPWLLLEKECPGGAIPVIADATTVQWTLHSKLGGELEIPGRDEQPVKVRIVALLQESIFQSELLMSAEQFEKLFPDREGFRFFLIDAPHDDVPAVKKLLVRTGFETTSSSDRVRAYLEVENTYLATFQALGSLGLILGTLGLAIVLLRGVWERRGELALLRALGYRRPMLGWLILAENGYLLLIGLGIGTTAAILSVAPQLIAGTGSIPWLRLLVLLLLVSIVGMIAGSGAVLSALRAALIPALRKE